MTHIDSINDANGGGTSNALVDLHQGFTMLSRSWLNRLRGDAQSFMVESAARRSSSMRPDMTAFFDEATNTITCVVGEPGGLPHAIIDSIGEGNLKVDRTLKTHARADHLTAARYLQENARRAMSAR